jgi:hypothetical protein
VLTMGHTTLVWRLVCARLTVKLMMPQMLQMATFPQPSEALVVP